MKLIINIPTRNRVGKQRTLRILPEFLREWIHVWCPREEVAFHRAEPYAAKVFEFHGEELLGIALSWQAQLDYAREKGVEWMWVWEDDIYRFDRWTNLKEYELKICDEMGIVALINRALDLMDEEEVGMVGVINRGYSKREFPNPTQEATRMHGCWAVRVPALTEIGFRFDEFGPDFFMGDFHAQLRLLESGFRSVCIQEWCWDQVTPNGPGGANGHRNKERQERTVHALVNAHPPGIVKPRRRVSPHWGEMAERLDVKVAWKKARVARCEM
jgi:hypothetical protein